MTGAEWGLCVTSVLASSVSQLFMKSASRAATRIHALLLLGTGTGLQLLATLLAVLVLRTLQLSQLIPFAASAYLLVPLCGRWVLGERLLPRFWIGALLIIAGIVGAIT